MLFPFIYLLPCSFSSISLFLSASERAFTLFSFPAMASQNPEVNFQDYLPIMANKLRGDGLIDKFCNGFNLLMDSNKGVITLDSLKRNSALLGLQDFADEDLRSMLREGDFDGDGTLNQLEFCVLMFSLSPELMEGSKLWLQEVLQHELNDYV
ncbi:calcium-binding protein PBP1-like [Prosopis cineraria]|uniref:calcium-binding protein PBP1-like n=1 Tax=Prosopis cineraria TaxID=364024 RepID=UPI00240F69E9|nr:calcium-binding protein PBP1-like [Prosopis cineraria]